MNDFFQISNHFPILAENRKFWAKNRKKIQKNSEREY